MSWNSTRRNRREMAANGETQQSEEGDSAMEGSSPSHAGNRHDPSMLNPAERRDVRHRYRELLMETQQDDDDEETDIKDLDGKVDEAEALYSKVEMTREAALDSKLLIHLARLTTRKMQAIKHHTTQSFRPVEFTERLAARISSSGTDGGVGDDVFISGEDWKNFGKSVAHLFKRSPSINTMLGSFEMTPQAPKPARVRGPRKASDLQGMEHARAPEKLKEVGGENQEVTTEEVERILEILRATCERNGGPVCFFEFVVHPHSFTQTVQNMFHITFLVKDGFVSIFMDDEGLPVIEPRVAQGEAAEGGKIRENQIVLNISEKEWREIVATFDIQHPLIPDL